MSVLFDDVCGNTASYEIANALMLRASGSAYLSRTPTVVGNRKTWTFSTWVKRASISSQQMLLDVINNPGGTNNPASRLDFVNGTGIRYTHASASGSGEIVTSSVFRDTSAWMHIVLAQDTTQATASERVRLYVNGQRITSFSTATYPAQNAETGINYTSVHRFGASAYSLTEFLDGYLAETILVDGAALDPSYFGKINTATGQWVPKKFTGSSLPIYSPVSGSIGTNLSGVNSLTVTNPNAAWDGSGYTSWNTANTTYSAGGAGVTYLWVGKQYSSAKSIGRAIVKSSSDQGFQYGHNAVSGYNMYVEYSDDGSNWTTAGSQSFTNANNLTIDISFTASSHVYWRVRVTTPDATQNLIIADVELYEVVGANNYGTNGFYLDYKNAAALGSDVSGRGNNWTATNIVSTDQVTDTPTNNFATLNPLDVGGSATTTLSNGNLYVTTTSAAYGFVRATMPIPTTGKWAWKSIYRGPTINGTGNDASVGVMPAQSTSTSNWLFRLEGWTGDIYCPGNTLVNNGAPLAVNDAVEWLFDRDANTCVVKVNGATRYTITGIATTPAFVGATYYNNQVEFDFGQKGYVPSDTAYKTLCTKNLPTPSIIKGSNGFNAIAYTGNGSPRSFTGVGHQPDLLWNKVRSNTGTSHHIVDSVRGVSKTLYSDGTYAEDTAPNAILSFDVDGFSVGTDNGYNANGWTHVNWSWKKGAAYGLDIVTWTQSGASMNVNHSLGVVPSMMIVKGRNVAGEYWDVYHKSLGSGAPQNYYLALNTTSGQSLLNGVWGSGPTSTQFTSTTNVVVNGDAAVGYLFADVEGFSKFGSYTGNGSADGPFVYCGFKPRWIMVKRTDAVGSSWWIVDTACDTYNVMGKGIEANTSSAESSGNAWMDAVSNGFKIRTTSVGNNASGGTYVYAAFAECPFKYAVAR